MSEIMNSFYIDTVFLLTKFYVDTVSVM